jgi:hypothetical protein
MIALEVAKRFSIIQIHDAVSTQETLQLPVAASSTSDHGVTRLSINPDHS